MVHLPSPEQLREVAKQCGLSLSDGDLTSFRSLMVGSIAAYNAIDALPDEIPEVKYPRTPGYQRTPQRTSIMPGTVRRPSAEQQPASSRANGSPSRTTSW